MIELTEDQIERYSRHILLQDVGLEGQEKILNARVLIVGAGGLGAPAAMYLAAAGVGHIGIVDADMVDLSNLQRQIIHFTKDVGQPKVESAKEKMLAINPDVEVTTYHEFMDSSNAKKIIEPWDFVIDGTAALPRSDVYPCAGLSLLPLFLQGAATSRSRSHLLAGRSARSHRWHAGYHTGCRGIEIYTWRG